MYILPRIRRFVDTLVLELPKKHRFRYLSGVQAFSWRPFDSINANGRMISIKRATGESRVYRALRDIKLNDFLKKAIIKMLLSGRDNVFINLDFSQYGRFMVIYFALATGKGRALPLCAFVLEEKIKPGGLIVFTQQAITFLLENKPPETKICLVMDRGFRWPRLFQWLITRKETHKLTFICRVKADTPLQAWNDQKTPARDISRHDYRVVYANTSLRYVRSNWRRTMKDHEPWYLLTNKDDLTWRQIVNHYAKRFEIEEPFKDQKWIQRLEWNQVKTPSVLEHLLTFIIIGWLMMWFCLQSKIRTSRSQRQNPKKRLSFFRTCWEFLAFSSLDRGYFLIPP